VLAGLLAVNTGLYFATFTMLTAKTIGPRGLLPGAVVGAVGFTALITVGTGLVTHQLKNASATYGAFGTVIGIVASLLLLAKISMYAAELNPVLARKLYPRALPLAGDLTDADRRVLGRPGPRRAPPRRPGHRSRLRRPGRHPSRRRRRPARRHQHGERLSMRLCGVRRAAPATGTASTPARRPWQMSADLGPLRCRR
jgi:hypothetical protein